MHKIEIMDTDRKRAVRNLDTIRLELEQNGGTYMITWRNRQGHSCPKDWTRPSEVRYGQEGMPAVEILQEDEYEIVLTEDPYVYKEIKMEDFMPRERRPGECCGNCRYLLDGRQLNWKIGADFTCDLIIQKNRTAGVGEREDPDTTENSWCYDYKKGTPEILDDAQWGFLPDEEPIE